MINDAAIRPSLRDWVKTKHLLEGTFFIDEMSILWGNSRIDVAVFDESITAYEIKAQNDKPDRLQNQVPQFAKVCQFCSLVVHPSKIRIFQDKIPTWWGLIQFEYNGASFQFKELRPMKPNPGYDVRLVALVLWRDELFRHLAKRGIRPDPKLDKRSLVLEFLRSIGNREGVWETTKRLVEQRQNEREWVDSHLKA